MRMMCLAHVHKGVGCIVPHDWRGAAVGVCLKAVTGILDGLSIPHIINSLYTQVPGDVPKKSENSWKVTLLQAFLKTCPLTASTEGPEVKVAQQLSAVLGEQNHHTFCLYPMWCITGSSHMPLISYSKMPV